jgi:putative FmdB family regulatory protein
MPIYEYSCPKCGEFERHQSLSDPTLKRCPTCRSKVTKLISASAFQLKGGGWYSDAYQKKAASSSTSGTSKESPKEGSKDTSKDSTPAAGAASSPSGTPSSSAD